MISKKGGGNILNIKVTKKEKTLIKEEQIEVVKWFFQETSLLTEFLSHIINTFPLKSKEESIELYGAFIKTNYIRWVKKIGWDEDKFKIILWNIALENEKNPFTDKTFKKYELKFYNRDLIIPKNIENPFKEDDEEDDLW